MDSVENKQLFQTPTNNIAKSEERTYLTLKKHAITKPLELEYNEFE